MEDLQEPLHHHRPVAQLLCIKDPRDYFDTKRANNAIKTEEAYGFLRQSISKVKSIGFGNSTVAPEIALVVFNGLQKKKPFLKEGSFPKRIQMARRLLLTLGTLMMIFQRVLLCLLRRWMGKETQVLFFSSFSWQRVVCFYLPSPEALLLTLLILYPKLFILCGIRELWFTPVWEPFALDEFEKKWEVLRERASTPKQKEWLEMMYEKRDSWAESCMRGKFFGGMCTTQRVESMNKYVKDYLRKGVKLFECIPAIDRAMLRLRNNTAKDGFNAKYSTLVLKTALTKLEQQASLIYTHRCFVLVRHEIESCSALTHDNVMHNFGGRVYVLSKYGEPHNNWTCIYHSGENMRIECGCREYESEGIPCCHLFYVMKCEHLTEISPALIMKRWTKSAQTDTCMEFIGKGKDTTNEVVEIVRQKALKQGKVERASVDNVICVADMDIQSVIALKETCIQVEMHVSISHQVVKAISIVLIKGRPRTLATVILVKWFLNAEAQLVFLLQTQPVLLRTVTMVSHSTMVNLIP
ncbi:hypothetical protein GBA52_012300 [Prunus armeniaca]|nr:hypothetical protein GBA52_012300 [Prunus armeniaca]